MRLAIDRLNDPIVRMTFETNDTDALPDTPPVVDTVPCTVEHSREFLKTLTLSFAIEQLGYRKKGMIV